MVVIATHRWPFFTKKEIWFYNGDKAEEGDYTSYCCANTDFRLPYDTILEEETCQIKLYSQPDELFSRIHTTSRYEIRKAILCNLNCQFNLAPSIQECAVIIKQFNRFAAFKKIPLASSRRILALQRSGNIAVTSIQKNEQHIVSHIYLYDEKNVVLLYSFHNLSFTNNRLRAYANKYLHWQDILLFKNKGLQVYDFGGINEEKVPGITQFKLRFGGEKVPKYGYTRVRDIYKVLFRLYKVFKK